jgi:hypothetical protein
VSKEISGGERKEKCVVIIIIENMMECWNGKDHEENHHQ